MRSISLDRLLVYGSIYNLNITNELIDELKTISSKLNKSPYYEYIFKSVNAENFLALAPNNNVMLSRRSRYFEQTDANIPFLMVGQIKMKFIPSKTLLMFLEKFDFHGVVSYFQDKIFTEEKQMMDYLKSKEFIMENPSFLEYDSNIKVFLEWHGVKIPTLKNVVDPPYSEITSVITYPDDTRLALLFSKTRWTRDVKGLYFTKPGDAIYNWTDIGRIVYIPHGSDSAEAVFTDSTPIVIKDEDALQASLQKGSLMLFDNDTAEAINRRWAKRLKEEMEERASIQKVTKKFEDKLGSLTKNPTESFSYNNVEYKAHSAEYEGQIISSPLVDMPQILHNLRRFWGSDNLSFDRVVEEVARIIYNSLYMGAFQKVALKIGNVDITINVKISGKAKLWYINTFRINSNEVQTVIEKALAFNNTAEYYQFCKSVASCSLRFHTLISSGLTANMYDEVFNMNQDLKLTIVRVKNKNFIQIDGKCYPIRDSNRLISAVESKSMARLIDSLSNPDIVELNPDALQKSIAEGRKNLQAQRDKETKFLEEAIKLFDIKKINGFLTNAGMTVSGFIVKGKLRDYLVDDRQCLVYEYPTGKYICMVDKGQNEKTNVARLVSRFYALSNDSRLAHEITTL